MNSSTRGSSEAMPSRRGEEHWVALWIAAGGNLQKRCLHQGNDIETTPPSLHIRSEWVFTQEPSQKTLAFGCYDDAFNKEYEARWLHRRRHRRYTGQSFRPAPFNHQKSPAEQGGWKATAANALGTSLLRSDKHQQATAQTHPQAQVRPRRV